MSNKFVGIETRNKKKTQGISFEPSEKRFSNRLKTKSDHNDMNFVKEEDYRKQQNKKVKTENNSETKITLPYPILSSKKNLKESLAYLKQYAADNETFQNAQDIINVLEPILEYKYRSRRVVFTKDIFQRKLKNNITPAIFTKKNLQIRLNRPQTPMQLAFENYLNLISQLYYKATHQLMDIYSIIEPTPVSSGGEETRPIIQLRRGRKPGRKAKRRVHWRTARDSTTHSDLNTPLPTDDLEEEEEKQTEDLEVKIPTEAPSGVIVECIDSLVSPLKVDYVFERWTPKEIAIFEAGICKYGKELNFLQFLIKTKTINDVIEFYFAWKTTNHYRIWKHYKNIENKTNYNSWL